MAPYNIEVDEQVWEAMKTRAEPFIDTPNTVLRKLLGLEDVGDAPLRDPLDVKTVVADRLALKRRAEKNGAKAKRKRAPSGSLMPEVEYERPILDYLAVQGGSAPARSVAEAVGKAVADKLTELDREEIKPGLYRWQNRIQFTRLRMVREELLKSDSPRGTWEIAEKGRAVLEQS